MTTGTVAAAITRKLEQALAPEHLMVVDDSHRHEGHVGARASGESHFTVEIVSAGFDGKSRLERQRLVYQILSEELAGPVHALSVTARTPAEFGN
jgi:BolA protein